MPVRARAGALTAMLALLAVVAAAQQHVPLTDQPITLQVEHRLIVERVRCYVFVCIFDDIEFEVTDGVATLRGAGHEAVQVARDGNADLTRWTRTNCGARARLVKAVAALWRTPFTDDGYSAPLTRDR